MSAKFNLTAQINLRAPSNLKPVVSDIKRQLGSITADVNIKIDNRALKSIDTATNRLTAMNKVLSDVRNNTLSLNNSLRDLSSSLGSVKTSGASASSGLNSASNSVEKVAKNVKVARTEMEEFGKQSALAVRRFIAFSAPTAIIFGLTNAVTQAFKAFISFDKELIRLQQVTGAGAIGISALESEVTRLSTSLGVSSESLMNVATTLAQAGLNAAETRTALEALAKTELAPSFENLTKTTEGAIAILRQFGLQASDLEAALGSVNAVSAAFAVESGDIIAAIQRTGGVFASASKGVTEGKDALNEFIAVFTSVRQTTRESAETIATGLRTIFTRIQRAKTIEQLKEFGVSLQDLEGKFVGPFEAVKRLSEALNQLDPRDIRFSTIVEELGGFRQIGKVIPLIQQFSVAQQALGVAQKGQNSLTDDQIVAQKSLANQLAKVREQFLALIREVGKSAVFQGFFKIVTGLASGLIGLANAFKPILPILAIMATIKGVSTIGQFATGFFGGLKKGGGAAGSGSNLGSTISGAKEKERAEATSRASDAIRSNTDALKSLTSVVQSLDSTIKSRGSATLASGGKVLGFNSGGVVPGSGKGDKVPALLEPGEVVMSNNAVNKYGRGNLVRMNKYVSGGAVETDSFTIDQLLKVSGAKSLQDAIGSSNIESGPQGDTVKLKIRNRDVKLTDQDFQNIWDISNAAAGSSKTGMFKSYVGVDVGQKNRDLLRQLNEKTISYKDLSETEQSSLAMFRSAEGRWGKAYEKVLINKLKGKWEDASSQSDYPIDIVRKAQDKSIRALGEAKFRTKPTDTINLVSKLLRYRIDRGSTNQYFKENDQENRDLDVILGKLDYFWAGDQKLDFYKWIQDKQNKKTEGFNTGGKIQKFKEGSRGGIDWKSLSQGRGKEGARGARDIIEPISTETYLKWAKGIYDEYDADPSLVMAIGPGGLRQPPEIALANKLLTQYAFETGGAGLAIGKRFVRTPKERISDELRPYLVPDPSDPNEFGFFEDDIRKFGRVKALSKAATAKLGRQSALEAAGARNAAYTNAESAISSFKETGKLDADPSIMKYLMESIANPDSLPLEPKELDKLKKKLTKPNLDAFSALVGPDKTPVGVQGQRTKLSEVFGTILETYGGDTSDLEIDNIIRGVGSKIQDKRFGGMIQKFMAGSVGGIMEQTEEQPLPSDLAGLIKEIEKIGGTTALYDFVPKSEIEAILKEKKVFPRPTAKQLVSSPWLTAKTPDLYGDRDKYIPALQEVIRRARPKFNTKQSGIQAQLLRNVQAASGQGYKFGLASIYGPQGQLGYSSISNAKEIKGPDGTEYLTQIIRKSLPERYLDAVRATSVDIAGVPARAAERLQYTDIFGTGGPLAFDFDETLVKGSDIPGKNPEDYSDLNKVQEALKNAELTLLGKELSRRISEYPQLLDSIRVLTARPQSNAPYLASTLAGLGLPIPANKITGVSGGLNKVNNLSELETLIDDNLENVQSVMAGGKRAILYSEPLQTDASSRSIQVMEGYALEEMVKNLGVKISPDDADPLRPIDYPNGLGAYARYWDLPPNIPTDTKRTNSSSALSRLFDEAQRFYAKNFATGGIVKLNKGGYSRSPSKLVPNDPSFEPGSIAVGSKGIDYISILENSGLDLQSWLINKLAFEAKTNQFSENEILEYARKTKEQMGSRPKTNVQNLLETLRQPARFAIGGLADAAGSMQSLMSGLYGDRQQQTSYLNQNSGGKINKFASGGTVPAMVSNGEAFVPPQVAKKIGYAKLDKMNQADRNGMKGFAGGGVSVFKGPGSGTSDSIGPIGLPQGSYVIREKATKALGLNKGGSVGLRKFKRGGRNVIDAKRAQGQILKDVEQAGAVLAEIMGQLPDQIREVLSAKFKGLKDLEPGDILMSGAPVFTENTRGQAVSSASAAAIGLQITGKKGGATTETVAHEAGHLADFELGGGKAASQIEGTFQFELVAKIRKDMEEAFKKAGENSDRINNYLLLGKELFAEFFAKASPEVRAIITSTTDAKEGMKKLAAALGPTGYTYAGLEASDIDPSLSAPTPQATPKPVKPTPTPVKPTTTTTNITDIKSASEAQKRLKELEVQKSSLESSGSKTKDPVQNALIDSQIKSLSSEINSITNSIDTFVNSIDPLNEQINAAAQLEQDAIEERKKAYQDLVQSIRSSVKDFDKLSPEAQARLVRTERDKDKAKFQTLGENVGYAAKERRKLERERKKTFGGATTSIEARESLVEKEKPKQSATISKAEADSYLEAKAKQLGQSVDQFTKSLVDAAKNNAGLVLAAIEAAKTELKVESIEIAQTLKGLGSSEEDKKVENALIDTLAKKIQGALPTKTGSESRNLAKELAEKLKSGLTFDEISASNNELAEVMTKNISIEEAQLIALRNAAGDSGASSAIIEASSAGDAVRNLPETTKIGKIIESLGGGFKATTRTLGLLAAASEALRNSFLDSGKKLSSQTQANFAFFENLGKGVAIAGELNIADSVNFVGEKLKGLGGRFEGFGKKLQQYSGAIQAGITVYYALGTAIAAAYNAFNQNELTLELDKLGAASSNTELAFKNLDQSGNRANVAAAKRAMKDEAIAAESLESRSMINLRDSDRSYARTIAGYEPTGAMAGAFGIPQEEEAKKAFLEFTTRQAEQAEKLGQIRLKSVRSSDIEADMKTANDFNDKLNRLEAEKARLIKAGADTAKIAAKDEEIRATTRAKAEALYKKSQTFATLIESGKTEDQALATIYSSQAGTEQEKERRIKLVTRTGGTKEEQDQAIAAAKAVAASAAENERRNLALANAYRTVSLQTENLVRTYDRVSAMLERFSQDLNKISESAALTAQSYGGNAAIGSIDRTNENILGNMQAYSLEEVRKAASDTGRLAGGGAEGKSLEDQIVAGKLIQESLPSILANVTGAGGADEVMNQLEDAFRTAGVELPKIVADELRNSLDDQLVGSEGGGSLNELINSSDILQEVNKQTAAAIKVSQEIQKQYNDALSVAVSMTNEYTKALEQATEYQLQAATIRINSENELAKVLGRETDSTGIEAQETRIGTLASGVIPGGRPSTDANEIFAGLQAAIQDQGNQRQELQRRSDTFQTTGTDQAKRAVDEQLKSMSKQNVSINNARKALEELANDSSKAANALKSLEAQQRAASGSVDFLEKVLTSDAEELDSLNRNMESYTKLISGKATAQDVNSLQFRKEAFGGLRDLQGVLPESIMKQMQAKMSRAMLESMPGGKEVLSRSTGALYQVYNPETKQMETKELTMEQSLNMMAEGKDPVQQQYIDAYREATANQAAAADALGRAATDVATTFSDSITSVLNKLQTDLPNILSNAVMIGMTAGTDLEKSEEIKVAFQNNRKAEQEKATLDEQQAQKMGVDYSDFTALSQSYDNVQKANEELARVQAQAAQEAGFDSFAEFERGGGEDFENFTESDANKRAEARIRSATTGFKDAATRAGLDDQEARESIAAYRNTEAYKTAQTRVETTRKDLRDARTIVPKSEEDEKTTTSEAAPTTPTKTTEEKSAESKKKEDEAANKSWRDAGGLIAASFLAAIATEIPKLFAQGASFGAGSAAGAGGAAAGGTFLQRLFGRGKKPPVSASPDAGGPTGTTKPKPGTKPGQGSAKPRPTVSTDSSPQAPRSRGRGRSTVFGTLLASAGLAYGASRLLGSNNASADEPNEDIPSSPIEDVTNFATEVGGEGNAIILILSKIEENTRNCCANSVGTSSQTSEDGASENQKEAATPETVVAKTAAQAIAQEFSTVESAGETAGSVATDIIGVRAAIQSRSTKPASDVEAASPRRVAANRVNAGLQGLNAGTQALGAVVSFNNALETGNLTDYGYAAAGTLNTAASLGGGRVVGAAGDAISFGANTGRIFSGQSLEEGSLVRDTVSAVADAAQVGLQLSPEIVKAISSTAPAVAADTAGATATGGRGLFSLLNKIPGVGALTKGVGSAAGYVGTRLGVGGLASAAGGALGSVGTGLGFGKPILGASGGIGAGVGNFAALNTAISAVTESLEFLSDPEAYSARKQAMSDAGLQRAQDRTGYGEFALDSVVGALQGFSNPIGKIVEGGYVAKDLIKDRAAASETQAKTERMSTTAQKQTSETRGGGAIGKLAFDEQIKVMEEAQIKSELQAAEKVKASGGSLADVAKIFDTSQESLGATNLQDFIAKREARLKELPQDRIDSRERLKDGTWDWSSNVDPTGFAESVAQEVEYRLAQLKLPVDTTTVAQPQVQSPAQKIEQNAAAPTPTVTAAPTTPDKQSAPATNEATTDAKETAVATPKPAVVTPDVPSFGDKLNEAIASAEALPSEKKVSSATESKLSSASTSAEYNLKNPAWRESQKQTANPQQKQILDKYEQGNFKQRASELKAEAEKEQFDTTGSLEDLDARLKALNESGKGDEASKKLAGKTGAFLQEYNNLQKEYAGATTDTTQKPEDSLLSSAIKILSDILVEIKKLAVSTTPVNSTKTPEAVTAPTVFTPSLPASIQAEETIATIPAPATESIPAPPAPGFEDSALSPQPEVTASEAFTPMDNARRNALANIPTKDRTPDQQKRLESLREKYKQTLSPEKQDKFRENQLRSKGKSRVNQEALSKASGGILSGIIKGGSVGISKGANIGNSLGGLGAAGAIIGGLGGAVVGGIQGTDNANLLAGRTPEEEKEFRKILQDKRNTTKPLNPLQQAELAKQKQIAEQGRLKEENQGQATPNASRLMEDILNPNMPLGAQQTTTGQMASDETRNRFQASNPQQYSIYGQQPSATEIDAGINRFTSNLTPQAQAGADEATRRLTGGPLDNRDNKQKTDTGVKSAGSPISSPIPALAPLPQSGGPVPVPSSTSTSSVPNSITIDQTSLDGLNNFNKNFDSYVTRLETLEFKPVQHKLDVNVAPLQIQITGAAAFEALDKNMKEVANSIVGSAISQLEQKIKSQIPDFKTSDTTGRTPS